jgi:hypothetical protein
VISGVAKTGLTEVLRELMAQIKAGSVVVTEVAPWQP